MAKTVLITGGASDIGYAIAKKFAINNYNIYLHYHSSEEKAKDIKEELENSYQIVCNLIRADITNEDEVVKMFNSINNLDCLVNNAALAIDNNYSDKTATEFNRVIETNLTGTFLVTKYASKVIDKGVIINVSSNNAINDNNPISMDYDASKAGVISLTHNFAKALAPNIRVNAIAPGWVLTAPVKDMNPSFLDEERKRILLDRIALPNEIANVVYFLASDEASYINDEVIRIDGGLK